jgi:hypothetical protein
MPSKAQRKANSELEILLEATKAVEDISQILKKSSSDIEEEKKEKKPKAGEESTKIKETEEGKEESKEVGEKEDELQKDGDNIIGEMPEGTQKSDSSESEMDFDSMPEDKLLDLASKALAALEARGVSERSSGDIESAEHEISELKEDIPAEAVSQPQAVEAPVMEKEVPMVDDMTMTPSEPAVASAVEPDLDSILGKRDVSELAKFHQKLGEHLAARNQIEKSSTEEAKAVKPEPAVAPAMAMMKSLEESFKKSLKESVEAISVKISPIMDENRKLNKELAEMKKSFSQFKKDLDSIPVKTYATANAKADEKLLVKSILESIPAVEDVNAASAALVRDILSHQRLLKKSNTSPKVKISDFIFAAEAARSVSEVEAIRKEMERQGVKL